MTKLTWDEVGKRYYEAGIKRGVLYLQSKDGTYPEGVAWSGITGVTEAPSGAEATPLYADDIKYLNLRSVEEFGATIEAYTYPDEFEKCDGSASLGEGITVGQQTRSPFGLCYRTAVGNDTEYEDYGYKLHLVYGAQVSPSQKGFSTINNSPDAITFSWEMTTTPVEVPNMKPSASITIDSTKVDKVVMDKLEEVLYGTDEAEARLPLPTELAELIKP